MPIKTHLLYIKNSLCQYPAGKDFHRFSGKTFDGLSPPGLDIKPFGTGFHG